MTEENKEKTIEIDVQEQDEESQEKKVPVEEKKDEPQEKRTPDYYDQLLRVQAEFQNYKKRNEQRLQDWQKYIERDLLTQLLPVIDDFDILFEHNESNDDSEICIDGVKLIYNKLLSTLKEMGLETIDTSDGVFDPNLHEAIMTEVSDKIEDGNILKVWQKGYVYKDKLLRPAKVITAKAVLDKNGENDGQ